MVAPPSRFQARSLITGAPGRGGRSEPISVLPPISEKPPTSSSTESGM